MIDYSEEYPLYPCNGIYNDDATCSKCPDYEKSNDENTFCYRLWCADTFINTLDGECEECGIYTKPNEDQTLC